MTSGAAPTPSIMPVPATLNDGGWATSTPSRSTNINCALSGVVFATGRTGTHSSCSASVLPICLSCNNGCRPWLSAMATNVAIAAVAAGLIWLIGIWSFLLVELPIILLAGSVGVWLFYVQHQFEMTFWAHEAEWSFEEAALRGSSHYELPGILRWFTANIGVHHVHHLCSRIPFYRLPRVLRE